MRILTIGNFGYGWDGSVCDEEHIAQGLEHFGHEVIRWQREGMVAYKENIYQADITLIAQWDSYPDDLWEYLPGKRVYWAFDYQAEGQEWHERLIKKADLYLSKRIADSKYSNWQWLAQDFAPDFLDTLDQPIHKDIDVLFTGTYLDWAKDRNEILKAVDDKYNLVIHSVNPDGWKAAGFKNVNGPVMDDALPELISRAKVNLSIDHTLEAGYWSDRNAQIMCCGGFVLFRYVPLSTAVFRSNISYFHDIDSCFTSLDYWLENDEDRENLAAIGHDFARQNLIARERVSDLLNIVGVL